MKSESKICLKDDAKRSEKNKKFSETIINKKFFTRSLKKMELFLKENPNSEFVPFIGMYIYYSKFDKVTQLIYPNLFKCMKRFELAIIETPVDDPYYEVYKILKFKREHKDNKYIFLNEAKFYINKIMQEDNLSINKVAKILEIKYANVYNFLKKDKLNAISAKNVHKLLWIVWSNRQGWTLEEAKKKHLEKFKDLINHWHVDIDVKK